jgi:aminoglycoside 3-N-acetyltransferase-4
MSEAAPTELSKAEITSRLRAMGVDRAGVLLVHTSFRALRPVEGGPLGLIEAIRDVLGPTGTLAMPSFSGSDDEPFDPGTSPASPDLGIVADTFWRLPGVLRPSRLSGLTRP